MIGCARRDWHGIPCYSKCLRWSFYESQASTLEWLSKLSFIELSRKRDWQNVKTKQNIDPWREALQWVSTVQAWLLPQSKLEIWSRLQKLTEKLQVFLHQRFQCKYQLQHKEERIASYFWRQIEDLFERQDDRCHFKGWQSPVFPQIIGRLLS